MPFDAHKNLAITTVLLAPVPATSGANIIVAAGTGARFPAAPFQATVWPPSALPAPPNAEVIRVTARTGDTLTIVRAQEGTLARAIVPGDAIAATITVKALTDLESGINFPQIVSAGLIQSGPQGFVGPLIRANTVDGADTSWTSVCGGGGADISRGAFFLCAGNESPFAGRLQFSSGNIAGGTIQFYTGPDVERVRIHYSGGVSVGGVPDPGVGNIGAVAFVTGSDARLKTDRGRHTDLDVLRRTVIHAFTWNADGRDGRGVFAQEAHAVAPFAVTPGTDAVDADGRLTQPWGVDYAKYVPDLLAGWQYHENVIAALEARVAALEARLAGVAPPPE